MTDLPSTTRPEGLGGKGKRPSLKATGLGFPQRGTTERNGDGDGEREREGGESFRALCALDESFKSGVEA